MNIQKKHISREIGIPLNCPLKCYQPAPGDIPPNAPEIFVGMDSGIGNTAFASLETVRDSRNAIVDFKFLGAHYFRNELDQFAYKIDRQIYLANQYFDLYSRQNVKSLTYELLPLTSIRDSSTLSNVIDAQATTDIINMVAYQLGHMYNPVPATAIKFCLTGNGRASKFDMCMASFAWTRDEDLLYNDHMTDAFAMCFYAFVQELKKSCMAHQIQIPEKFSYMGWNYGRDFPSNLYRAPNQ